VYLLTGDVFVCVSLQGRSLFTPRANPHETSLKTLIKGPVPEQPNKVLYEGQDVHNPCFDTQPGEVDVYAVASNRRQLLEPSPPVTKNDTHVWQPSIDTRRVLGDAIVPGKGWEHIGEFPGDCDGTYNSICGRHFRDECPMIGHHDSRGQISGNEYSGWLVLNIPEVNEGLIMLNIGISNNTTNAVTEDWTRVNNEGRLLRQVRSRGMDDIYEKERGYSETDYIDGLPDHGRGLGGKGPPPKGSSTIDRWAETMKFDYAIDGKIIETLNKEQFVAKIATVQRTVLVLVLLDDPNFGHKENVEVAIRMRDCGRDCTISLTHIYWA
jgi:hypothetical protein